MLSLALLLSSSVFAQQSPVVAFAGKKGQAPQPAATLGTTSITVGPQAATSSVELATQTAWTAVSNSAWLHVSSGSASGTGNALIVFSYDTNTATSGRIGTLTIAGFSFTVNQAASGSAQ